MKTAGPIEKRGACHRDWAATQWVAWRFGYQPQLGQPWFELVGGVPVYLPPA